MRLDARVRAYLAGPPLGGARMYAAPTPLAVGEGVPGGSLARKLDRLGYRPVGDPAHALAPGEYRAAGTTIELAERPSPAPWAAAPRRVRVGLEAGRVAAIEDLEGGALDRFELEPEMLAVLGGGGATLGASPELAPPACRSAVLAAEDRHFFLHPGVDPVAIARALVADLRAHHVAQGASTLTQQLAKNAFLSPRRTLSRKLREAVLALLLEARASKEEILGRYVASVYLGVDGGLPVHGFSEAAQVYFGKPLGELEPAECALLAGIIRSPNGLSPRRRPRAALARRNRVLEQMVQDGLLERSVGAEAMATSLKLAPPKARPVAALYVASEVARQLPQLLPRAVAEAPGLRVFTSIDADAQREAERATRHGLAALERGRRRRGPLQAALVALDPHTGCVRALVGGRDYGSSPLDRAVRSRRQPGSAFRPFVYVAALDPARRGAAQPRTVVSLVEDTPLSVRVGARVWQPVNYDGTFAGTIPLEDAIAESRNAATVRVALDVGLDAVARAAAGKTGTTDDTRDAWFVGFTPEVVAGVWVGLDGGGPTGLTGAQGALPIWTDFVRATSGEASEQDFPVPDDIVWREVDPASGELATAGCPESRHEPFLAGTEPTEPCRLHREAWAAVGEEIGGAVRGGGRAIGSTGRRLSDWFRRLFR